MAETQYVTFYVNGRLFGIDIRLVREVCRDPEVTPVSRAPEFIRGLLNLRGQLVTVIDMNTRLGTGRREGGRGTSCIVLKTTEELRQVAQQEAFGDTTAADRVGLLVDAVGDAVTADESQIEGAPPHAAGEGGRFLSTVVKLDDGLLATHNMSALLGIDEDAGPAQLPEATADSGKGSGSR